MGKEYVIQTKMLTKIYANNTIGLTDVNVNISKGEMVAVVGASGSGKTTFLNIIGGLDIPTSGNVLVQGINLENMNDEERTAFRRKHIGFIFQDFNLIPVLNTYENIMLPLEVEKKSIEESKVDAILKGLGILDKKYSLPSQMSGGQQQRVAIARALISKPELILADEPTGNLDSVSTKQVVDILKTIGEHGDQTIIIITHNEEIAKRCNRIIRIEDGHIKEDGE